MKRIVCLIGLLAVLAFCVKPVLAETFDVYPGQSIQTIIGQAVDHDIVQIHAGTYNETAYFDADSTAYIGDGIGQTIITGTFVLNGGSDLGTLVSDMSFTGPNGAGLSFHNHSGARLENLMVDGKQGTSGIFVGNDCEVVMNNSALSFNTNGAVQCYATANTNFGHVTINNCLVNNNASAGAVTTMPYINDEGQLAYQEVEADRSQSFGGAFYLNLGGGHLSVDHSALINNGVAYLGGACYAGNDANTDSTIVDLFNTTVVGNEADQDGSVFWGRTNKARLNVSNSIFYNNGDGAFHGNTNFSGCNVAWPNDHGIGGAIVQDPEFCGLDVGNYRVTSSSICLPANNNCGLQIGAFGQGCDGISNDVDPLQPEVFKLMAYPNPFNPTTMISFDLRAGGQVSLKVYDLNGQMVRQLLDEQRPAGLNNVNFDATQLATGTYFCRLEANGQNTTSKLLLVK